MNLPWQPFILGLANRIRGGLIPTEHGQVGRLVFWALPLAFTLWLAHPATDFLQGVGYFILLILSGFIGSTLPKWGKYWDLGRNPENPGTPAYKWAMMTLQGLLFVAPPSIAVCLVSPALALFLAASGLLIAPAYELGWRTHSGVKDFEAGPPMGEIFEGFFIGVMIFLYKMI